MISTSTSQDRGQDWPPVSEQEHRPLHEAVLGALGPLDGRRLLDVGCGVGMFLRAAERRGALVAGTDTTTARLEIARWALPDADLRVTDPGDALPFDSGTFDVVTARTGGSDVLIELARVVRPGGLVAVGGWVRPAGCWAETFAGHLRRLSLLPPTTGTDDLAGPLRVAELTVRCGADVRFTASYPSSAAAWTAMLGCEDMLRAIRQVGEAPVRAAFAESVAENVAADGTVGLPKTYRYTVASVNLGIEIRPSASQPHLRGT